MPAPGQKGRFPRFILVGAALLIGFTMYIVTGAQKSRNEESPVDLEQAAILKELQFENRQDGSILVSDPATERAIIELAPGSEGFIWGVLRGLERARTRQDIPLDQPYRLARMSDGRLFLEDPATSQIISLRSFGPTNARAFGRLLDLEPKDG